MKIMKFFAVAQAVASLSKDQRKKVGALILGPGHEIRATGYNGFARGVNDDDESRHHKPEKFFWTCHAEENAIAQAARSGVSTEGCTLMVTTLFPCSTCARMIIQAGIREVIAPLPDPNRPDSKWLGEARRSREMFREAGILVTLIKEKEDGNTEKAPSESCSGEDCGRRTGEVDAAPEGAAEGQDGEVARTEEGSRGQAG